MFNIKNQIRKLYTSSILGILSLSGAWVAILAARGFSLAQIGFAETVFHIVSLLFEIPSGALADVIGRKKTLILAVIMRIISCAIMVLSNNFAMICLSLVFCSLFYNFTSGSDDALAYDSMKSVGKEDFFEKYASNQLIIYRVCEGISTLAAGLSLALGYKISYLVSIGFALAQLAVTCSLTEIRVGKVSKHNSIFTEIKKVFVESFKFIKCERKAVLLMFTNSLVGAFDVLLLFFLQAKLPSAGIPKWALGLALLCMQTGGVLGARIILHAKNVRYRNIFAIATLLMLGGIAIEHSGLYVLMTLGGFISALADDALQVRTNTMLQDMFPSEQRATLISIESFTFSVIMIVLSPLAGIFFEWW